GRQAKAEVVHRSSLFVNQDTSRQEGRGVPDERLGRQDEFSVYPAQNIEVVGRGRVKYRESPVRAGPPASGPKMHRWPGMELRQNRGNLFGIQLPHLPRRLELVRQEAGKIALRVGLAGLCRLQLAKKRVHRWGDVLLDPVAAFADG